MQTIKNLERLQKLHHLICSESTGTPSEISNRMFISLRLMHNLLDYLKDYGAVICYDRGRKTYYYKTAFELSVTISVSTKSNNCTTQIIGKQHKGKELLFAS
jgi:predicted transcriptional regulator